MITYYLLKWKGVAKINASWEKASTLWLFKKEVNAFKDTLLTRTSASSGGGGFVTSQFAKKKKNRGQGQNFWFPT